MLVSIYVPVVPSAPCEPAIDLWNGQKYVLSLEEDFAVDRSSDPSSRDIVRQVEYAYDKRFEFGTVIEFAASKSNDGKPIKTRLFQHSFGFCRLLRDPVNSGPQSVKYYVEVQTPTEYVRSNNAKACGLIGGVA